MLENALWGACGAAIYAGSKLIAILTASEAPDRRKIARAIAQFALAMVAGIAFAAALTGTVMKVAAAHANVEAVAFFLGLCANALWPILVDGVGRRARIWSGETEP